MGFRKNSRGKFLLCSDSNSDDDFNRSKKSKGASSDSKPAAAAAAAVVSAASNSRDSEGDDSKFDDLFGGKFDIMLFLDRGFFSVNLT